MQDSWEVEQKYAVEDKAALEQRLKTVGFECTRTETHCDIYFRHPCRDFRQTDEAFRLRTVNENACVTYKGPRLDTQVKTRPEIELGVVAKESRQWEQLLSHLSFEALPAVRKTRRVFTAPGPTWQDCCVCVDEVQELGNFAEVEVLVNGQEPQQLAQAEQRILTLADQLGLTRSVPLSYLSQLLAAKGIQ